MDQYYEQLSMKYLSINIKSVPNQQQYLKHLHEQHKNQPIWSERFSQSPNLDRKKHDKCADRTGLGL